MLDIVLGGLLYLFYFWVFFVIAVSLKNWVADKPAGIQWTFRLTIGLPFLVADGLFDIVVGSTIYWRGADYKNSQYKYWPLFTDRLIASLMGDPLNSKRWRMSRFICAYLIEPFDPGHCRLADLRLRMEERHVPG